MTDYVKKPANEFQATMQIKKENIAEAQKRKNDAIQIAGLQRDATLLTCARMNTYAIKGIERTQEQVEEEWQKWHDFLQSKLDKQILGF
jgi:hypothetical protein